jgi:hypothetical protein
LGDEIDGFGGAANENDLAAGASVHESHQPVARRLVQAGRFLTQRMNTAVNVGMVTAFVIVNRIDDGGRPLRRRAIVQIGQRFAVDHASKDRKVVARGFHVKSMFLN